MGCSDQQFFTGGTMSTSEKRNNNSKLLFPPSNLTTKDPSPRKNAELLFDRKKRKERNKARQVYSSVILKMLDKKY
jgi:hypothetical protein